MCQPVSEPARIRWAWGAQISSTGEVRAEQGLRGPLRRRQSAGSQLQTSTTALHLVLRSRGEPAHDALTPPQSGPRPSVGLRTGAARQVGCSSDLVPTSWAEWLHPRWFSDQAQDPGPISQTCFPRLLSQGPSPCWSSHEAPRGQDVPRSDREAERLPCPPPGPEQGLLASPSHQETLVPTESSACRPSGADACLQDPSGSTHHTCSPALGPSCYLLIHHPVLTSNQKLT